MSATVRDIYQIIDTFAPFDTAASFDNVGLLVGSMNRPVDTVLTALDATPAVVGEARSLGAQLLVTHHPLMFTPRNRLDEADPEAVLLSDLIRAGVSLIAAHTNLDIAPGGVNDALAARLGWPVTESDAFLRLGVFPEPVALAALQARAAEALGEAVLRFGPADAPVSRFAISCGSGGSELQNAAAKGADLFFTGELKHSIALEARARGMTALAAGHRATEVYAADLLAKHLLSSANAVQYKIRVFVSKINPFG